MNRIILLAFIILFPFLSTALAQNDSSLKGKRILIVYGGWEGHEPRQTVEVFLPWLKAEGALVDTTSNLGESLLFLIGTCSCRFSSTRGA